MWTFFLIIIATVASIVWVDRPVAMWLHQVKIDQIKALHPFMVLPIILSVVALACMVSYTLGRRAKVIHRKLFFVSIIFMTALAIKNILKLAFGRTWPLDMDPYDVDNILPKGVHASLITDGSYLFRPFAATKAYTAFPSGTALAIYAAAVPLCIVLPKWRWLFMGCALLTVVALLQTNTHFVSDIVVGVYLGVMIGVVGARLAGLSEGTLNWSEGETPSALDNNRNGGSSSPVKQK